MQIPVKAKISGYHPATGLHLEAGQSYTIDQDDFSEEVFAREDSTTTAAGGPANEGGL